jgi:hypothetical protein
MTTRNRLVLLAIASSLLVGCGVGKKSVLFVTKTSFAVDVDTNPPTFDVGYGRYEGSIAPVVKEGAVLPLLSSISADAGISSAVFGSGVTQNFGVGNAAIIMSQFIGSNENPADGSRETFDTITAKPASVVGTIDEGKRYFFGTKTTIGFSASFAPERSFAPDSISLGYKRKELAYVPIKQVTTGAGSSAVSRLHLPSLLATSGNSASAGSNQAGFGVTQFYATGESANFLAAHPVIRNSVISKIIGDQTIEEKFETARLKAIDELDKIGVAGELATLKAKNVIDNMPEADLDGALASMIVDAIAANTEVFSDYDSDGTISDSEKRTKLKALASTGDDKELIKKVNKWVSDNS